MRLRYLLILIFFVFFVQAIGPADKSYFLKVDSLLAKQIFVGENLDQWSSQESLNNEFLSLQVTKISKAFILDDDRLQNIFIIQSRLESAKAKNRIEGIDGLLYIEEVPDYATFVVPNDVHPNQWNLAKINAFDAFDIVSDASDISIAIVDDAVLVSHPDLQANIYINPNEILNGIDDDGNGYVDDISGYDVADNDNDASPPSSASSSNFSHGTHCAGIASAATNNGVGIASIGMNAKIIPVKCKPDATSGGSLPFAYKGLEYAIASNCDVISMSWGGGSYSNTYQILLDVAHSRGKVLVAAAGNSNLSAPMYPASYNHVISVAASDRQDAKAGFSNYGSFVDVTAPGKDIWSTVAGSLAYDYKSGTSMACPLVSGLAALMLASNPGTIPDSLESCLKRSCDNIDAQNSNYINKLGAGRVNAFNALGCLYKGPLANFTNQDAGCPRQAIQFMDNSSGQNPKTFKWSFPGGNPASSTLQNPIVTYPTSGTYSVTLEVSNSFGSDTRTKVDVITISEPTATIDGDYNIPAGLRAGLTIEMLGSPPFSFVLTDGGQDYTYTDIYYSPHYIDYGPVSESRNVEFKSFSDANCNGSTSGVSSIEVIEDTCVSVIFNGDFGIADNANCKPIGYFTDMVLDCVKPGSGPPGLFISPDGSGWNGGFWSGVIDHTPGGGTNVVLGDGPSSDARLWYQFVNVQAGKIYDFSAWFVNANVNGRYTGYTSSFEIRVKGMNGPLLGKIGPLGHTTPWTELKGTYTATATETIEIDIVVIGGPSGGNDFAIDDVSFKCSQLGPPCVKSSNTAVEMCDGDSTLLSVGSGSDYKWYPKIDISAFDIQSVEVYPNTSRYFVCHYIDDDECLVIDSFFVRIKENPELLVQPSRIDLCAGDSVEVVASGANVYSWSPTTSTIGANTASVVLFPINSQDYIVTGIGSTGCVARDTVVISVTNCCSSRPKIGLDADSILCLGEQLSFTNKSSPKGTPAYEWTFGSGADPEIFVGENPPPVTFTRGGSYEVKLVVNDDCGADSTLQVVHCADVPVDAGNDSALCFGDEYRIGAIGISDYEYMWTPCINLSDCEDSYPTAALLGDESYVLTVRDPYSNCLASDTVHLTELSRVKLAELLDQRVCIGETVVMTIESGGQEILWKNGSSDSIYLVTEEELVWVTVSNEDCELTDTAFISFYNCKYPYVINSFTPNNDNLNEDFGLLIDFAVENYLFQVFNRWGEMLYESEVPNQRWDGSYKGKPVQSDSYIWQVMYTNTETPERERVTFSGVVTLIR